MSTNFYVRLDACKYCGRAEKEIHLGKSAVGWKFLLQANGYQFYKDWEEMKDWLKGKRIFDEYGKEKTKEEFIEWVENRKSIIESNNDDYYDDNISYINGYKFYDVNFS